MLLLTIADIREMVRHVGIYDFYLRLGRYLTEDFSRWQEFQKSERHALAVPHGVIELMPISNDRLYSFKYVNGHPRNPSMGKMTVVAFGVLADVRSGYPLLISEMTLLTALRTAATSALASKYMAKEGSRSIAMIGCGAQSEFQILAHQALLDCDEVHYFDIDAKAMQRFDKNLREGSLTLYPHTSIQAVIQSADIVITATAAKGRQKVLEYPWILPGQHIGAIGGDSPGKTELDPEILTHADVVVEYFPQTSYEGEIQNLPSEAQAYVYAELWEILSGRKAPKSGKHSISVFDSVGFALEDYSILRLCYNLAEELRLGEEVKLIPNMLEDCKDLYGILR